MIRKLLHATTIGIFGLIALLCGWLGTYLSAQSESNDNPQPGKVTIVDEKREIDDQIKKLRESVAGPTNQPRPKVLLFGTFHFTNPGLDAHKSKYTYDVFSERGQKELNEVLDRLTEFKPTKVLIENASSDQKGVDAYFDGYKKGNFAKNPNESLTVGCAMAKRLGLQQVHGFDAEPKWLSDIPETREQFVAQAKAMGMEDRLQSQVFERFKSMYKAEDDFCENLTLRQRLLLLNHPERLRLSHGAYFFFANFEIANGKSFPGPDGFCSAWHNRNLRMFSNIQRLATDPQDRLLVVVGAGHVPILEQCVKCCPTMTWVDMWDVLGPRK